MGWGGIDQPQYDDNWAEGLFYEQEPEVRAQRMWWMELAVGLIPVGGGGAGHATTAIRSRVAGTAGRLRAPQSQIAGSSGRARFMGFRDLPPDYLGVTYPNGDIYIQGGLSRQLRNETLWHEQVHSFLSVADDAPFSQLRQDLGQWSFDNSAILQYAEEVMAETYATGSLRAGLRFPIVEGYTVRGDVPIVEGLIQQVAASSIAAIAAWWYVDES